jgi:hypothetical protein
LEQAIGVAASRALAHGDSISRAELAERTVVLLIQRSNAAAHDLMKANRVRAETLPAVESMRDEVANCLDAHFVTVTKEEDARRQAFEAQVAAQRKRQEP